MHRSWGSVLGFYSPVSFFFQRLAAFCSTYQRNLAKYFGSEEPSARFLVVVRPRIGSLRCYFHFYEPSGFILFYYLVQSSFIFFVQTNPALPRSIEGPVLSLTYSVSALSCLHKTVITPHPTPRQLPSETACSCVFRQNNNLLTHPLILSVNMPLLKTNDELSRIKTPKGHFDFCIFVHLLPDSETLCILCIRLFLIVIILSA